MADKKVISLPDRFDFSFHKEFTENYEASVLDASVSDIVLDFSRVDYLDSSALGMLLMLREYAGGNNANITLRNCSKDIKTILSVANFQSLFNIA